MHSPSFKRELAVGRGFVEADAELSLQIFSGARSHPAARTARLVQIVIL